jgi:hypothetical protein
MQCVQKIEEHFSRIPGGGINAFKSIVFEVGRKFGGIDVLNETRQCRS